MGAPPRENVSNWRVRLVALREACSASVSIWCVSDSGSRSSLASPMWAMIPVSALLKSCAMPPARTPSDSSLFARCSSRSSCWLAVSSRNTSTTPSIRPVSSRIGVALSPMTCSLPCLATSTVWFASSTGFPEASTRSTGFSQISRVCSFTMWKTSSSPRPRASASAHPVSSSATGFSISTSPSGSVVITPSAMERRVTSRRCRSCARACSARLRRTSVPRFVPSVETSEASSVSSCRRERAKNASTASTSPSETIGTPNPAFSWARRAASPRTKLPPVSVTSSFHSGRAVTQTRPGRPRPGLSFSVRVTELKSCSRSSGWNQDATQRSVSPPPSSHDSP